MKTKNPFIAAACDQAGEVCELVQPVATPAPKANLGEIEQAVLAERERCAKVAESMQYDVFATPVNVAAAIRKGQP